jgi:hypothetical protein
VCVPNWPFYNRNPLEWLPVSARAADWAAAAATKEPAATPSKKPRKPAKCAPVHPGFVPAAAHCVCRQLTCGVWTPQEGLKESQGTAALAHRRTGEVNSDNSRFR